MSLLAPSAAAPTPAAAGATPSGGPAVESTGFDAVFAAVAGEAPELAETPSAAPTPPAPPGTGTPYQHLPGWVPMFTGPTLAGQAQFGLPPDLGSRIWWSSPSVPASSAEAVATVPASPATPTSIASAPVAEPSVEARLPSPLGATPDGAGAYVEAPAGTGTPYQHLPGWVPMFTSPTPAGQTQFGLPTELGSRIWWSSPVGGGSVPGAAPSSPVAAALPEALATTPEIVSFKATALPVAPHRPAHIETPVDLGLGAGEAVVAESEPQAAAPAASTPPPETATAKAAAVPVAPHRPAHIDPPGDLGRVGAEAPVEADAPPLVAAEELTTPPPPAARQPRASAAPTRTETAAQAPVETAEPPVAPAATAKAAETSPRASAPEIVAPAAQAAIEPAPPTPAPAPTVELAAAVAELTEAAAPMVARASAETTASLASEMMRRLDARSTRFDVALTPDGLGQVNVAVEIARDGSLSANLNFERPQSAQELNARSAELRQALEQAGFDLAQGALSFTSGDGDRAAGERQAHRRSDYPALFADPSAEAPTAPPTARRHSTGGVDLRV